MTPIRNNTSPAAPHVMAEQLGKKLGQAVVVDKRPGEGGRVGGLLVFQAPADATPLMLSNSTPISIGPLALEKQPYDPVEGFTHVVLVGRAPCGVMVHPAAPMALNASTLWQKALLAHVLPRLLARMTINTGANTGFKHNQPGENPAPF